MKSVLFIDRDGTIIQEPPVDFQVDSLEKLAFLPKSLSNLRKISEENKFELAMVTNQDGLGTDSFPENTFWPAHLKMMQTLEGENIKFQEVFVDKTFEHENAPTRKPRTGLLGKYLDGSYDLKSSFVIGDRVTDIILAQNLGCKAIFIGEKLPEDISSELADITPLITQDWDEIYAFLKMPERIAEVRRTTKETDIFVKINLDGKGKAKIETGLGFFDHMLDQLAKHGGLDLEINVKGDLQIDEHHTIEDTALALGEVFLTALGNKQGINRYGFLLPMDECLSQVAIDFSGRPWLVWDAKFSREKIGDMPTEMFMHFFKSFSDTSKCNLNIKCQGDNEHHKIESIFKAWAKAIKMAAKRNLNELDSLPSTKGTL
jgi:imidazoleglycerol-phosphate dehydratase / histidinol-phosphatase